MTDEIKVGQAEFNPNDFAEGINLTTAVLYSSKDLRKPWYCDERVQFDVADFFSRYQSHVAGINGTVSKAVVIKNTTEYDRSVYGGRYNDDSIVEEIKLVFVVQSYSSEATTVYVRQEIQFNGKIHQYIDDMEHDSLDFALNKALIECYNCAFAGCGSDIAIIPSSTEHIAMFRGVQNGAVLIEDCFTGARYWVNIWDINNLRHFDGFSYVNLLCRYELNGEEARSVHICNELTTGTADFIRTWVKQIFNHFSLEGYFSAPSPLECDTIYNALLGLRASASETHRRIVGNNP